MTSFIKKNIYCFIFYISFLLMLLFLIFKSQYGYIYNDEPAIFAIGYRFALGDKMLVEDWSIMQLVGFLIYPFAKFFILIKSDTNWILLYGRLCYVLLWSLTVIYSYFRLRKYKIWAVFGLMSLYMFAPLDMMTLSYNSFCLMGLVCTIVTVLDSKHDREYIIAGLAFAVSVLCNPYLIVLYTMYCVLVLVDQKYRFIYLPNNVSTLKSWIYFTIGSSVLLVLLLIFIFSKTDLQSVIVSLKYILKTDTEHNSADLFYLVISYFKEMNLRFSYLLILSPILFVITVLDKKRYSRKLIYFSLSLIPYFLSIYNVLININKYPNLNLTVIPLIVVGVESYILTKNKNKNIFSLFIILGLIFSFFFHYASNLGLAAIGTSYSIITAGSIILIGVLYEEQNHNENIIKLILICTVIIQLAFQLKIRYENYYLDDPIYKLTTKIEVGPAKGIYTNENDAFFYNYQYEQLLYLIEGSQKNDKFYYPYSNPWFYLGSNMQISTYSTWGSWNDAQKTNEINEMYFIENSQKIPNYILLDKYSDIQLNEFIDFLLDNNYSTLESFDYMMYYK